VVQDGEQHGTARIFLDGGGKKACVGWVVKRVTCKLSGGS